MAMAAARRGQRLASSIFSRRISVASVAPSSPHGLRLPAQVLRTIQWKTRSFSTVGGNADSHDDFKPVYKTPEATVPIEEIKKLVQENPVVIFMKGVPDAPRCGFSMMASRILQIHNVPITAVDILENPEIRTVIKSYSNWPTFPQVFIKGEFVGGSDILKSMNESGELDELLKDITKN